MKEIKRLRAYKYGYGISYYTYYIKVCLVRHMNIHLGRAVS